MPNPLSRFLNNRFIQPAVDAGVAKALSDQHPPAYGASTVPEMTLGQSIGQPHDADYTLLYSVYKLNVDVAFGVHAWKGSTTSRGWHLDVEDEQTDPTDAQQKEMGEIARWLKQPNPKKGIQHLLEGVFMHLAITGDAFWYVSKDSKGKPLEIWPMHPALTKIIATKQGEVVGYVMKAPGEEPVRFEPDEVLHFTTVNPNSDIYGEGAVELVLEEAGIDLQALRSNKAIFQNGLNPSAVLLMDDTAKSEDAKQMTAMLKQSHSGSGNQHKLVALSKTRDFKPWTLTHKDMEYLGLRNLSTTKVARGFRMPVFLFGEHNAGDFATAGLLVRETHQNVYIPLQNSVNEVITDGLIKLFNPAYCFKLNQPDSSNPDELRRDYMQAKRDGIVEVDEARERGFGLNPLQDTPASDPEDYQGPEETSKTIRKALSQEELTTLADSREADMESLAQAIEPSLVQFFTAQEQRYLERLSKRALKSVVTKDVDTWVDEDAEHENELLHALMLGLLVASLNAGVQVAQLQISMSLSLEQANGIVQDYLKTQAAEHVAGINQTTRDRLRSTLSEGLANRETNAELASRVSSVFTDAKGYRSQVIARTETAQAYSYANEQALEATGVVGEYQWLTAEDERVCPICGPLHGARRKVGQDYDSGLRPAFAHIQCRCSEIGLTEAA